MGDVIYAGLTTVIVHATSARSITHIYRGVIKILSKVLTGQILTTTLWAIGVGRTGITELNG